MFDFKQLFMFCKGYCSIGANQLPVSASGQQQGYPHVFNNFYSIKNAKLSTTWQPQKLEKK